MAHAPCPICGAYAAPMKRALATEAWLCSACAHTFVGAHPTANETANIYDDYGYTELPCESVPQFLEEILDELLESFERHRRTGRLLDVGFGAGGLLQRAKRKRWSTYGVELSRAAVERGRKLGLGEIHHADFVASPLEADSFDVIVMTELIEHLPTPQAFLDRARELLRPGGLLYMTTPHGRGLSGRVLGASWSVLRPPEHLQLFSVPSMQKAVAAAGFSSARIYTQGLLPHELVAKSRALARGWVRSPIRAASVTEPVENRFDGRVNKSYSLNASLMRSGAGRATKQLANIALAFTRLGDSLRVEAIR